METNVLKVGQIRQFCSTIYSRIIYYKVLEVNGTRVLIKNIGSSFDLCCPYVTQKHNCENDTILTNRALITKLELYDAIYG